MILKDKNLDVIPFISFLSTLTESSTSFRQHSSKADGNSGDAQLTVVA